MTHAAISYSVQCSHQSDSGSLSRRQLFCTTQPTCMHRRVPVHGARTVHLTNEAHSGCPAALYIWRITGYKHHSTAAAVAGELHFSAMLFHKNLHSLAAATHGTSIQWRQLHAWCRPSLYHHCLPSIDSKSHKRQTPILLGAVTLCSSANTAASPSRECSQKRPQDQIRL